MGFSGDSTVRNPPAKAGDVGSTSGLGRSSGEGNGNPVFLPGKSHEQSSLAGYQPLNCKQSDMTEGTEHALSNKKELT